MPIFNAGQDPFWIPKFRRAVCSLSMSSIQALFIWISKEKYFIHIQFSSVQSLSRVRLFVITRPPSPSPTPRVHSDSHPLSRWCHPAISSSVIPFSSWPQSLPASESFPMSQLFAWFFHSPLSLSSRGFLVPSSLSAIRVVPSAYLRLLIFLPAILFPACASSSPVFLVMYSAYVK